MPKIYGYMRVSTREQNEDRQRLAMLEYGVPEENLFLDKQSGKDFERPSYQKLLAVLRGGDTLVIKSIDRLGRNYDEILEQWRYLTKEKQVGISVLDMPVLDTVAERDLLGRLVAEIMLQVLSYVAQQEREYNGPQNSDHSNGKYREW
ncbi:recombinase family protein [bacterium]|nr:recombinase family protein [bacterium]